jgi:hypothetical protein
MTPTKSQLIDALRVWIRQRPGLDYGNYGEPHSYRAELRSIARDKRDAEHLLRAVELSAMTGQDLLAGFRAFSGRLEWTGKGLQYTTGQYWPTEYRKAVAAVCASALWDYYREDYSQDARGTESPGDAIRRNFKRVYGRTIQHRWFD